MIVLKQKLKNYLFNTWLYWQWRSDGGDEGQPPLGATVLGRKITLREGTKKAVRGRKIVCGWGSKWRDCKKIDEKCCERLARQNVVNECCFMRFFAQNSNK